ncbi:MAG: putative bacterial sensory transduction regulator [Phormidium sp. OSCR]|nr:MAG: putative bacterial sensory transduction regulator [Phormidium sp. OSCR]
MFNHKMSKTKLAVSLTSLLLGLGWVSSSMTHAEAVEHPSIVANRTSVSEQSSLGENSERLISQSGSRIYSNVSTNAINTILDRAEFFYRRETNTLFLIRSGSFTSLLSLEACSNQEAGTECSMIGLSSSFEFERMPSLERVNEWNKNRKSKAFVLENDRVLLQTHIVLLGGVTETNIVSNIVVFFVETESFLEFFSSR